MFNEIDTYYTTTLNKNIEYTREATLVLFHKLFIEQDSNEVFYYGVFIVID